MTVTKSSFEFDGPVQRDGSQWVREKHLLSDGSIREYYYLLAAGDDANAVLADHAAAIDDEPAEIGNGDGEEAA